MFLTKTICAWSYVYVASMEVINVEVVAHMNIYTGPIGVGGVSRVGHIISRSACACSRLHCVVSECVARGRHPCATVAFLTAMANGRGPRTRNILETRNHDSIPLHSPQRSFRMVWPPRVACTPRCSWRLQAIDTAYDRVATQPRWDRTGAQLHQSRLRLMRLRPQQRGPDHYMCGRSVVCRTTPCCIHAQTGGSCVGSRW